MWGPASRSLRLANVLAETTGRENSTAAGTPDNRGLSGHGGEVNEMSRRTAQSAPA